MINQITAILENIFPKLLYKNSGRNGIPLKENGDSYVFRSAHEIYPHMILNYTQSLSRWTHYI